MLLTTWAKVCSH